MEIEFSLVDEKTVTNTTVKVTVSIQGTINGTKREALESRCLDLVKSLFPNNQWAFANFVFNPDGLTFTTRASTRIDASLNDGLVEKAKAVSTDSTKLSIQTIDPSIPAHDIRQAESAIRQNLSLIHI